MSRTLTITVESADGLLGDNEVDKLDPYVVIQVGSQTYTSPVAMDAGENPVWNWSVSVVYNNEPRIEFSVMEHDDYSRHDLLGAVGIDHFMFERDGWEGGLTLGMGTPETSKTMSGQVATKISRGVVENPKGRSAADGSGSLNVKFTWASEPLLGGSLQHGASVELLQSAGREDSPEQRRRRQ